MSSNPLTFMLGPSQCGKQRWSGSEGLAGRQVARGPPFLTVKHALSSIMSAGGFMVYTAMTTKYYFAVHPGDVFWCTADCGWVTGHSYITYGEGATPAIGGAAMAAQLT